MGLNTQQDPIGIAGGLNLYGYANGDPVNLSDPFGLSAECCRDWLAAGLGFVPVIGDGNDLVAAFTGYDVAAGEEIGGWGRAAAVVGVLAPVGGGHIRKAGDFLSSGARDLAERWGRHFDVNVRPSLGADGASSAMLREVDEAGSTVSMTHRVVSPDGTVIHQNQTHVGVNGTRREFPDEWVQFPNIDN